MLTTEQIVADFLHTLEIYQRWRGTKREAQALDDVRTVLTVLADWTLPTMSPAAREQLMRTYDVLDELERELQARTTSAPP